MPVKVGPFDFFLGWRPREGVWVDADAIRAGSGVGAAGALDSRVARRDCRVDTASRISLSSLRNAAPRIVSAEGDGPLVECGAGALPFPFEDFGGIAVRSRERG